jgi:hypothetical protein
MNPALSPEAARSILALGFGPAGQQRMQELAGKACEGGEQPTWNPRFRPARRRRPSGVGS